MKIAQTIRLAMLICSASLISVSSAGADDAQESAPAKADTPPAAASPGLFDRAKSWFTPSTSDAPAPKDDASTPAPQSDATVIKKIDTVSAVSAQVFDPTCHTLVQPFGMTDSMLSLTRLMIELKAEEWMHNGGATGLSPDSIKKMHMAAKNLNWLPMEAERMLGQHMHQSQVANMIDPDESDENKALLDSANKMLATMVAQIDAPTPYEFKVFVRQGSGNAQALPGGIIYIDEDLVSNKKLAGKAIFAVAHELSHVLQRHETHATQARLTDGIDSVTDMTQMLRGGFNKSANLIPYSNRVMTRFVRYSEDQELQADACAVRLLNTAFKDKKHLVQIIREFKLSLGKPVPAERASTDQMEVFVGNLKNMNELDDRHPNTQIRDANLERMLTEVSKTLPPEKPNQPVKIKKAS